jgi:hypothetical protein
MTTSYTLSALSISTSRTTGRPAIADGFRGVWAKVCSAAATAVRGLGTKRLAATLARSFAASLV